MMRHSVVCVLASVGLTALMSLYVVGSAARPDKANQAGYDLETLRRLPVIEGGRTKPLDTVARNSLRLISGQSEVEDKAENKHTAIEWLMEVIAFDPTAMDAPAKQVGLLWESPIFRIDNDQVLNLVGLKPRSGFRYALNEFYTHENIVKIENEVANVLDTPEKKRDLYQNKLLEFRQHMGEFEKIRQLDVRLLPPKPGETEWRNIHDRKKAFRDELLEAAENRVVKKFNLENVRPNDLGPDLKREIGKELREARVAALADFEPRFWALMTDDPEMKPWTELILAYREKDSAAFNAVVARLSASRAVLSAHDESSTRFEVFFNRFAPFYKGSFLYVFTFVLSAIGLLTYAVSPSATVYIRWPTFAVIALTILVHTFGLFARMYIQDRWGVFVTNLYSSAIFIGWGCVALGMIIEVLFPRGIGNLIGSLLGFLTSIVAHNLGSGDTMEMMQAVLDTNFWLATHVTCVATGYTATFVAGFIAMTFILLGTCTPMLDKDIFKKLNQMIYGVLCFATMLSFTGTVLGGIWADQSWGRFWGWDPKENGAVMIVIWNALILHARWGGLAKARGIAVMAVLGNIVTTWSWFGTNMLGVGLHSYGFSSKGLWAILTAVGIFTTVAALGWAIPTRKWRSFGEQFGRRPNQGPDRGPRAKLEPELV